LVATIPAGGAVPTSAGYGNAALICIAFLLLALVVTAVFYVAGRPTRVAEAARSAA
jgi:hypothetical protein